MAAEVRARPPADVVVVAAGGSRRMGGTDKLEAMIGGLPLLARTVAALAASPTIDRMVIVTAPGRVDSLRLAAWLPTGVPGAPGVVAGGTTRQQSVAAGVRWLHAQDPAGDDRPVLVHDGARPLVSPLLVTAVVEAVSRHGAALPVLPLAETLKRLDDEGWVLETVDRSAMGTAQTPQGARRRLLLDAWSRYPPEGPPEFTDEAALLEACRIPVHAIPGEPANLKVTLPQDLRLVEQALAPATPRVGFGHDSHPFGPEAGLRLGGLDIPEAPRLAGHSDGDVVLHALADALLGAAGLGDLGRLFPADRRTPRGIASEIMLRTVTGRLTDVGLVPASIDLVIIGARPKLGPRLEQMSRLIAGILDLPAGAVNVKASTGNLAGDEGAGRSISAHSVAVLRARA